MPWISADPVLTTLDDPRFPLYRHASPVRCALQPGETLYLPSMWFHKVQQRGLTIAVNFWHDMEFEGRYVYHKCISALASSIQEADHAATRRVTGK